MLPIRDDASTHTVPWMTYTLLLVNVVVFLFVQPAGFQSRIDDETSLNDVDPVSVVEQNRFSYEYGAIPCELAERKSLRGGADCSGARESNPDLPDDKNIWITAVTHMFLHAHVVHLLGNMLFLWVFGAKVEDRIGPGPYLGLFLLSGVVAMGGHAAFHWHDAIPMLGASGAIAGLLGAYLVFRPRARLLVVTLVAGAQVVYVPAWVVLGLFFLQQFFIDDSGVAWIAHATGMVCGAVLAVLLKRPFPDPAAQPRPAPPEPAWSMPDAPPTG